MSILESASTHSSQPSIAAAAGDADTPVIMGPGLCAGACGEGVEPPAAHMASQSGGALSSGGSVPCCVEALRSSGGLRRARGTSGAAGSATAARAMSLINAILASTPLSTDAPAPSRSSDSTLSCCLRALSLACSPARASYATSSYAWPPMLHDCVPQRLSSRRQQAGACSFACLLASLVSYWPLARLRSVDGSSGKLGRRRVVRALVRRSRTRPRWESPQRRAPSVP